MSMEPLTIPSSESASVLGQVLLREWVLLKKEAEYIVWNEDIKQERDNTFKVIDEVLKKLDYDKKTSPILLTLSPEEAKITEYLLQNRMIMNGTFYSSTFCKKTKTGILIETDIINDLLKQLLRMSHEH